MPFTVSWNGQPLPIHPARVSSTPINQIWSGHQRPVEQTEVAWFVTFDLVEGGELTIIPDETVSEEALTVLPLSFKPPMRREGRAWIVHICKPRHFTVMFGKKGRPLHVFANPPFDETRKENDIEFGPGEHHVGVILPKSGQTVRIAEGAVVYGAIIVAHARNVRIVGRGIVDGSFLERSDHFSEAYRAALAAGLPEGFYGAEMAVTTFTAAWSENVTVDGVIFRDPPRWAAVVRAQCRSIVFNNVKIIGCWRYNSDGIDVCSSVNVSIRNSFIRSFDDCIVARGAYLDCDEGPTCGVSADNCVLWCDWGKNLEVWAGHKPCHIENIRYSNIACIHTTHTVCDVTTWFGSPDTHIRNVSFENIEVDYHCPRPMPIIQNTTTDNASCSGEQKSSEVIAVTCGRLGRYLGNQKWEPADDLSGLQIRYENVAFKRFRFWGDVPRTKGIAAATVFPHTIEGLVVEDLPDDIDMEIKGAVKLG